MFLCMDVTEHAKGAPTIIFGSQGFLFVPEVLVIEIRLESHDPEFFDALVHLRHDSTSFMI